MPETNDRRTVTLGVACDACQFSPALLASQLRTELDIEVSLRELWKPLLVGVTRQPREHRLTGSPETECEVWQQDFLKRDLPEEHFDVIFANAALFHVPSQELPRVSRQLHATLKPGGVLFSSNPHGGNEEGWNRGRYGAYHSLEAWRRYMSDVGFAELEYYYRPAGLPREGQPWLASVSRRAKKTK